MSGRGTGTVISGVGQSDVGRRLGRSGLSLTVQAALEALSDAGLDRSDIDGISTWPGGSGPAPGFTGAGVWDLKDALGLNLEWFSGGSETGGQLGAIINAVAAVRAGMAKHVLCFRTVWESTAQTAARRASVIGSDGGRVDGSHQWMVPFGAVSATNWAGLLAARHFHEYGTTREQVAGLATTLRANAFRNPKAVLRDPMSVDDYLNARMISEPLCLFDCDIPTDGSTAVIVSAADTVADLAAPPVCIEAVGGALHGRPYWDQYEDLTSMAAHDAAVALWRNTELTPAEVDIAQLYDGFSILTLIWLEALGLCGKGESGPFVAGGARIAHNGELPLNTGGGQLSGGRLHGFGHLHEACVQLRGTAGERQVPGDPQVAVVAAGGGYLAGALLLTRR
ncbi:thiolase family protein [[Mycobacterium] vasticus]|uniref:Thiolase family protein n=1 Tax=[Mycobacterium] vasticus TaxID=2875777 RepID=A0ABU5YZY3_9MYCO|nr:thiolase family protein [Mycolicibacter sp. MYC017]MEB3070683.1 thiolase family protein [Mycolicibacter sp. MYC017]